eukprot:CAMPEP_0185921338 /NCGR_PEP_ID=MMETSP0924C-20121207/8875_1 /TAXON_ID=321610 /ORGANISM="Perkinsus chesapeaki, Strain ATCC PRA-65" /LENGTH=33 /DNA_ID= /DNA_START= /DNA_END= /DNA_ORIENTATION=
MNNGDVQKSLLGTPTSPISCLALKDNDVNGPDC